MRPNYTKLSMCILLWVLMNASFVLEYKNAGHILCYNSLFFLSLGKENIWSKSKFQFRLSPSVNDAVIVIYGKHFLIKNIYEQND